MELDDIPVLRHLPMAAGVGKVLIIVSGLFVFPLAALVSAVKASKAQFDNERRYHMLRAVGWVVCFLFLLMVLQCWFHNFFGGPDPLAGNWVFITWLFSSAKGADRFWNESGLYLVLIIGCFTAAWLTGGELDNGTFIPRFGRRKGHY